MSYKVSIMLSFALGIALGIGVEMIDVGRQLKKPIQDSDVAFEWIVRGQRGLEGLGYSNIVVLPQQGESSVVSYRKGDYIGMWIDKIPPHSRVALPPIAVQVPKARQDGPNL